MMITYIGMFIVFAYVLGSITYVYAFRGTQRYSSFKEYIRKGWPFTSPLNSFLYLFTQKRAKKPIMNFSDFPELNIIKENWEVIREEAIALKNQNLFDQTTDKNSDSYYDLGFRTFYKYGWSKFYLTWYGSTHNSAKRLMPKSTALLEKVKCVNGSMLTILPPGSQLTRHLDPMACSLRFHLGLSTPNDDKCFINIDGQNYSWRDGEALVFDETFLHYAQNNTDSDRLILMCDVDRPMTSWIGYFFNWFYKLIARQSVVPNTSEDKRGFINKIFSTLSPALAKSKTLKETNRPLYLLLKYTVNTTLALVLFGGVYALFLFLSKFF